MVPWGVSIRVLGTWLLGLLATMACGGSAASPAAGTTPAAATGAPAVSLRAVLGPLGAHRTPEQLAEVAAYIRRFEQDPYGLFAENDTGLSTPAALLAWVTESPDVTVVICPFLSEMSRDRGGDVSAAVSLAPMLGMTAYLIEHPGADPAGAEVQIAGTESAVRWYAAGLRHGQASNALFEELSALYAREGVAGLRRWYTERGIRCGDAPAPAAPSGNTI